jgi:tRNA (cytidine/uridine-2'-O-)-methyltransferase
MAAVEVHEDFPACRAALRAAGAGRWWAIETGGTQRYDEVGYAPGDVLLFGSEGKGLPPAVMDEIRLVHGTEAVLGIPMCEGNRSLNLSNAVTLVTYEAWRQNGFGGSPSDVTR